jgi:hypothetical protein
MELPHQRLNQRQMKTSSYLQTGCFGYVYDEWTHRLVGNRTIVW